MTHHSKVCLRCLKKIKDWPSSRGQNFLTQFWDLWFYILFSVGIASQLIGFRVCHIYWPTYIIVGQWLTLFSLRCFTSFITVIFWQKDRQCTLWPPIAVPDLIYLRFSIKISHVDFSSCDLFSKVSLSTTELVLITQLFVIIFLINIKTNLESTFACVGRDFTLGIFLDVV